MHPILFRIPLPSRPLMIWWALVLGAFLAIAYAVFAARQRERGGAVIAGFLAVAAIVGAVVLRKETYEAAAIPIYSYGVMLGLSLVVGWYITLTLAERDGLPKEVMANCYVITAVTAVVGSRILYVLTNLDEFHSFADFFAFRRGGLVAYGGFLGGYLGSWAYLRANRIRLMPWADVAVPSLASGLFITRIGCYLFGCDFGRKLPDGAPAFLQKLGTFPHWAKGTLENGDGSPAFVRHMEVYHLPATATASLPVHPTQIYESLCGLALFFVCLWQRKHQKFRGQIFFTFAFGYGFLRFILEMMRDDVERGEYGPMMQEHVLVPGALLLMSVGFAFGFAVAIRDAKVRLAARVVAFLPPVVAFIILQPPSFGSSESVMLSTSQWIGLLSALAVSAFYAQYYQAAKKAPKLAMGKASLGDFVPDPAPPSGDPLGVEAVAGADPTSEAGDEREDDDLDDLATADKARTLADAPRAKKKARDKRAPKADPAPPKQNATDAHDATDAADATAATAVRAKGPAEDAPQPVVAEGGASKPEPEPEAAPKAQG